jgi:hypothetical protein
VLDASTRVGSYCVPHLHCTVQRRPYGITALAKYLDDSIVMGRHCEVHRVGLGNFSDRPGSPQNTSCTKIQTWSGHLGTFRDLALFRHDEILESFTVEPLKVDSQSSANERNTESQCAGPRPEQFKSTFRLLALGLGPNVVKTVPENAERPLYSTSGTSVGISVEGINKQRHRGQFG